MPYKIDRDIVDAAKRAADTINTYRVHRTWDELQHKYIAISLADGSHDGTLYDTKADAVKHQRFENQCAYVAFRNLPGGASAQELMYYLQFNRDAYRNGMRLVDPDAVNGGPDLAPTSGWMDHYRKGVFPNAVR